MVGRIEPSVVGRLETSLERVEREDYEINGEGCKGSGYPDVGIGVLGHRPRQGVVEVFQEGRLLGKMKLFHASSFFAQDYLIRWGS